MEIDLQALEHYPDIEAFYAAHELVEAAMWYEERASALARYGAANCTWCRPGSGSSGPGRGGA